MALIYAVSGPVGMILRRQKGVDETPAFLPDEDEPGDENSGADHPQDKK